jgi:hypothetical protein
MLLPAASVASGLVEALAADLVDLLPLHYLTGQSRKSL